MGVHRVDPGCPQQRLAVDVEQHVHGLRAVVEVAALDEHAGSAKLLQGDGLKSHVSQGVGRSGVEQGCRLGQVRGDERGERQQVTHGLNGIVGEQPITARGDHHRVKNNIVDMVLVEQEVPDGTDDACIGKHADLDGVEAHIGNQRLKLLGDELRWYDMYSGHANGALGGEGRDHGRAVDAQRRERLEVGLDASTAGRVAARDS